ncbi:hypothetical protein PV04_01468 [Phialophora macrospora]|uniref:RING-type domain-containing protein n=1 Tax=Phialophora macrospora TaxID=1851006 RepID=A0A0D2FXW3_9EURO|nr:hypothetical protein PV04_01468 [Phialophora macrospora]
MKNLLNRLKKKERSNFGSNRKVFEDVSSEADRMGTKIPGDAPSVERSLPKRSSQNQAVVATDPTAVATHSGFNDWLTSFTPADPTAAELPDTMKPTAVAELPTEQTPIVELQYVDQVDATDLITVNLYGLRRRSDAKHFTARLLIPIYFTFEELNELLEANGFQPMLAAQRQGARDFKVDQATDYWTVMVINGPSAHSKKSVLRINQNDIFSAYIKRLQKVRVECRDSSLIINDDEMRISFKRTLRLPDDDKTYDLPSEFGNIPLYNVSSFANQLSETKNANLIEIAKKGGVFLPLYQREATWLAFSATDQGNPFAIRVFVGGVNAISGRPWNAPRNAESQDYVTIPSQQWLDGIAVDRKTVRQFVAMPLGSGYTVEKQMTGEEKMGGFQIEIIPSGPPIILARPQQDHGKLNLASTPAGEGLIPGDVLEVSAAYPLTHSNPSQHGSSHLPNGWPTTNPYSPLLRNFYFQGLAKSTLDGDIAQWRPGAKIHMTAIYNLTLFLRFCDEQNPQYLIAEAEVECAPWSNLLATIEELHSTKLFRYESGHYLYNGELVNEFPIRQQDLKDGDVLSIHCRRKTPMAPNRIVYEDSYDYGGYSESFDCTSMQQGLGAQTKSWPSRPSGWELGIAAGARLRQQIYRDYWPREIWRPQDSVLVPIQILNSVAFESVTGMLAPPTPITVDAYIQAGIPFHVTSDDHLEAASVHVPQPFQGIKSIGHLDAEGGSIKPGTSLAGGDGKVACTICRRNLCDCILRPCNHTFCASCVLQTMAKLHPPSPAHCRLCGTQVDRLIGFSAPMALPGQETIDLNKTVVNVLPPVAGKEAFRPRVAELDSVAPAPLNYPNLPYPADFPHANPYLKPGQYPAELP